MKYFLVFEFFFLSSSRVEMLETLCGRLSDVGE